MSLVGLNKKLVYFNSKYRKLYLHAEKPSTSDSHAYLSGILTYIQIKLFWDLSYRLFNHRTSGAFILGNVTSDQHFGLYFDILSVIMNNSSQTIL